MRSSSSPSAWFPMLVHRSNMALAASASGRASMARTARSKLTRSFFLDKAMHAQDARLFFLVLLSTQRHLVIMRVRGLVGGSGRRGLWLDGGGAIATSAVAAGARAAAGVVR